MLFFNKKQNIINMRHIALLSVGILMTLLTGCTQDDIWDAEKDRKQIVFTPMEFEKAIPVTRGSQATVGSTTSYGVSASIYPAANSFTSAGCGSYWYNAEVVTATGKSGYYWPGADKRVSFFAYAPYGATGLSLVSANDNGYPRYTYTVPTTVANQADFMTANVTDHSGAGITTSVPLTFSHQCADIRFLVYNQGTTSITVHSIAIYGVKYSGTFCESSSPKWTLSGTVNSTSVNPFLLSLGTAVAAGATVDMTGTTNHFIMLPQTVASGTQIFDVDATVNGVRSHYYHNLPSALELQAQKSYAFTLTLGEGNMIVDTTTDITDWEVEVKYLTVSSVSSSSSSWSQPSVSDGEDVGIENWVLE